MMKKFSIISMLMVGALVTGCLPSDNKDTEESENSIVERLEKNDDFSVTLQEFIESADSQSDINVRDVLFSDGASSNISVRARIPAGDAFASETGIDFDDEFAEMTVDVEAAQTEDTWRLKLDIADDSNSEAFGGAVVDFLNDAASAENVNLDIALGDVMFDIYINEDGSDFTGLIGSPAVFQFANVAAGTDVDIEAYAEVALEESDLETLVAALSSISATTANLDIEDVDTEEPGGEELQNLLDSSIADLFVQFTDVNFEEDEDVNSVSTEKYSYEINWDEVKNVIKSSNEYAVATNNADEINSDELDTIIDAFSEDITVSGNLWVDEDGVIQKSDVTLQLSMTENLLDAIEDTGGDIDRSIEGMELELSISTEMDDDLSIDLPDDTFDGALLEEPFNAFVAGFISGFTGAL